MFCGILFAAILITARSHWTSDFGGHRGWALAFSGDDEYAAPPAYFSPSSNFPTTEITVSAWLRFMGFNRFGGKRSFSFSMIAAGDSNHVQPFSIKVSSTGLLVISGIIGTASIEIPLLSTTTNATSDVWNYWFHITTTYRQSGSHCNFLFYFNGTLAANSTQPGNSLRWSDDSTIVLGGYALSNTGTLIRDRFIGWIDELKFYNRILSSAEIASNWQKQGNTSDTSLFIYYNFDEGPKASSNTIINHGTVGSMADLMNGEMYGGGLYYDIQTSSIRSVKPAKYVPGVPVLGQTNALPISVSVDATTTKRVKITCSDLTVTATSVQITTVNVTGQIYQAPTASGKDVTLGAAITTAPTTLTSTTAELMYVAPSIQAHNFDVFTYSCTCGSATEIGKVVIRVSDPPTSYSDISVTMVVNTRLSFGLGGTQPINGLLSAKITSLPAKGTLYQSSFDDPDVKVAITAVPTNVTNPFLVVEYSSDTGEIGVDTFTFKTYHHGVEAVSAASVKVDIQSWDYPPSVPAKISLVSSNRQEKNIPLQVEDSNSKQFVGIYILSLPAKGKLYQVDGSGNKRAEITQVFSPYIIQAPVYQYASAVVNVSSFWGGSMSWSPLQTLGPQDCFVYGDCILSWSPLTIDGAGGFASGEGNGVKYANNPTATAEQFGWTEFIELSFDNEVYISELLIGENRGMGTVKNIKAKDFLGNWMTIHSVREVDWKIQELYSKFSQYRNFLPEICKTPFKTKLIRIEMDTRVPDWNEIDFVRLGGTLAPDESQVYWNGVGTWNVIYEPNPDASGLDSFTYNANNCPTDANSWGESPTSVEINVIPTGTAGTQLVNRFGATEIDLSLWSVNSASAAPLSFTITRLPSSGVLKDMYGANVYVSMTITNSTLNYVPDPSCNERTVSFSYSSSDPLQVGSVAVVLSVNCPRECTAEDLRYEVSECTGTAREVSYYWKQEVIDAGMCVPGASFPLPSTYTGIECGEVPFSSTVGILTVIFAMLVSICGVIFLAWMVIYRSQQIVKLSQPGHSAAYCAGGMAVQFGWVSFVGPLSPGTCMIRPWILSVAYSVMFGALVRKIFVVMKLLDKVSKMKKTSKDSKKENQRWSMLSMFFCVLIDIVVLIPWTAVSPMKPESRLLPAPHVGEVDVMDYTCSGDNATTYLLILIAYKVFLTLLGAVFAFKVKSLDSVIGESSMMLYSTYNLLVCGVLLLVLTFVASVGFTQWLIIASGISCFAIMFSLNVLFVPKIYLQQTKADVNAQRMFGQAVETIRNQSQAVSVVKAHSEADQHSLTTEINHTPAVSKLDAIKETEDSKDDEAKVKPTNMGVGAKYQLSVQPVE
mmetsp:Transcript_9320/g.9396  ORF Transcript_9320/g.9396 Transcript_9320/m.9396 type:complete len:1334 (-) Transcript_9320:2058-6059(-)